MKRVRIQSSHGILFPGGLASSPRRAIWRSKQQTLAYLAGALVLYGLLCTTRNTLRDADMLRVPVSVPEAAANRDVVGDDQSPLQLLADATDLDDDDDLASDELLPFCPEYGFHAARRNGPSTGARFDLPFQRPAEGCRKAIVPEVEAVIGEMRRAVEDPDLFRLFENCFPNTLDTSVMWTGVSSENEHEELTFITTGDIHAMWLRDSANQLQSYVSLLKPITAPRASPSSSSSSPSSSSNSNDKDKTATARAQPPPRQDSLASLFRGAINLQARYITASPYCNAFQAPAEAGSPPANDGNSADLVWPPYDPTVVFECKFELDSLAAFLQLSWDYYSRTKDARFFLGNMSSSSSSTRRQRHRHHRGWLGAVETILDAADAMRQPTYQPDGTVPGSAYRFERVSMAATETLANRGNGSPVRGGTGLVRSAFRPSDDATMYQLLVPANMMFARYLEACAEIAGLVEREAAAVAAAADKEKKKTTTTSGAGVEEAEEEDKGGDDGRAVESVAERMKRMAREIKKGVDKFGKVKHPEFGQIYAYEVDGYYSSNLMDDANLPSLLSAPLTGYISRSDSLYRATRRFALSTANPYYDHGPVLNATGGPHVGPGMVWPMSLIVGIMTSDDDAEIRAMLRQVLASTDGLGLMHESVNVRNAGMWTRAWFAWANGLFGQMMLDLRARKPHILRTSFQGDGPV